MYVKIVSFCIKLFYRETVYFFRKRSCLFFLHINYAYNLTYKMINFCLHLQKSALSLLFVFMNTALFQKVEKKKYCKLCCCTPGASSIKKRCRKRARGALQFSWTIPIAIITLLSHFRYIQASNPKALYIFMMFWGSCPYNTNTYPQRASEIKYQKCCLNRKQCAT